MKENPTEENIKAEKRAPLKTALNIAYYVVLGLIILIAAFYMFVTFSTKNGVTSVFGKIIATVQTGSMSGTLEEGDLIVISEFDERTTEEGDIISFFYTEPRSKEVIIVTHRAIGFKDGMIVAHGDAAPETEIQLVSYFDVVGRYEGFRIPVLGGIIDAIKSPIGFFFCVLLPVFLFLFWQIYVFIKTVMEVRSLGHAKSVNDEARALAEQMFREMQAKQAADANGAQAPPEDDASNADNTTDGDSTPNADNGSGENNT